jgi:hypothetical protein
MKKFESKMITRPVTLDVPSAWQPLAKYIPEILAEFNIPRQTALEFGVERGFSASLLSNYFNKVIGVDTWDWVIQDGGVRTFEYVSNSFKSYHNVELIQKSYSDFIKKNNKRYDLIHVDIGYETHTYAPTLECGEWSVLHSDCVLFHDTLSFPEVAVACEELAAKHGFEFYNITEDQIGPAGQACGLGILIKK